MTEEVINLAGMPRLRGRDVWRQGAKGMKRAFPDVRAGIEDVFAAGDRVAVRLTFGGTHTGEFRGIPAIGRAVAEEWICSDTATLFRRLGVGG